MKTKTSLAAAIAFALSVPVHAADAPTPQALDAIVVQAQIAYRDRTDAVAPTLSYDLEYFQRFEPLTA